MRKHTIGELEHFFAPFAEASSTWARLCGDVASGSTAHSGTDRAADSVDGSSPGRGTERSMKVSTEEESDRFRDGVLVHMPDKEGDSFRADTKAGRYRCVLPTCDGLLTVHAGGKNVHHWQHRSAPSVEHSPETLWHITAKAVLTEFARSELPDAVIHEDDRFTQSRNKPDVWVRWDSSDAQERATGSVAFEAQHSAISTRGLQLRNARYTIDGVVPVWLFSHLAAPAGFTMSGPEIRVRLHEAHKLAADAAPLRWLNPDEGSVATAYVQTVERPDVHRGEVWHVPVEPITYTRHAGRGDLTVHIALDPLADCTLNAAGLHTPTDRWIEVEATRAADLERQARDEYVRSLSTRAHTTPTSQHRWGRADHGGGTAGAATPSRLPLPPVRATLRIDPLAQPCRFCGGSPVARGEWPSWYRPPASVTEVVMCGDCESVLGTA